MMQSYHITSAKNNGVASVADVLHNIYNALYISILQFAYTYFLP